MNITRILPIVTAFALGCSTVTPGTVVVAVDVCGASAGAQKVIRGGRYTYGPCTDYYPLVAREQRAVWTAADGEGDLETDESISFAGSDGQKVNVDVGVGYRLGETDEEVLNMVTTYGYDVDRLVSTRVRDTARDALNMCAREMPVEVIYGAGKAAVFTCAEEALQAEYSGQGLTITRLTLNSEVRLPDRIRKSMEEAMAATQDADRTRRQIEQTRAEGEKTVAQAEAEATATLARANAEAEANRVLAASVTRDLLELRRLDIEQERIRKWDGALPIIDGGNSSSIIMDVGELTATRGGTTP